MARIILSALATDIRGKLGGSVFQTGNGGLQIRTRVSPRNPRSINQQVRRSQQSLLMLSWRNLSDADRATWSPGLSGYPDGYELYIAVNNKIISAGQDPLNTFTGTGILASTDPEIFDLQPTSISIIDDSVTSPLPAGNAIVVVASAYYSGGISVVPYKSMPILTNTQPGFEWNNPFDLTTLLTNKYGTAEAGQKISFGTYLINFTTGDYSDIAYVSGTIIVP